jgi:activating signal cointegrator complex subunit 1
MIKDTRPLKLHATVVKMSNARAGGRHNSRRQTKPQTLGTTEASDSANLTSTMMTGATEPVASESLTTDKKKAGCDADAAVNEQEGEAQCEESKPKDRSNRYRRNTRAPTCFDATALLEQFKDFVWAVDVRIEKVAICKMGAKKIFDERGEVVGGEYEEVAYIDLP